jgi:hypothetical protein
MPQTCEWPDAEGCNELQPKEFHAPGLPKAARLCQRHAGQWRELLEHDPQKLFETFGFDYAPAAREGGEPAALGDVPAELDPHDP